MNNYKGFKYIGSKDGRASFKHPKGHYISVAMKGLSKEHKKAIEELAHGGMVKQKMAQGGQTQPQQQQKPQQPAPQPSPQPTPITQDPNRAKQVQGGFNGALGFAEGTTDGGVPDVTTLPDQPQDPPQAPEAPPEQPQAAPQPVAAPSFEQAKQAERQPMDAEAAAWEHDIANGHVTPETYQSLFNKKDTLGKIGTIFGLMVGGIGSGMSHQPNVALSMMDKQIQNDLEAKKASKQNAIAYRNMALQERAQPTQLANIQADTAQKQLALQMMYKKMASFHYLVGQVNNMPESPQKQNAKMALGMTYDQMKGSIADSFDAAAGNSALLQQQSGIPQENPSGDNTILKPGASLQGSQFNPVVEKDYPGLSQEFNNANQADKLIKSVPDITNQMAKSATNLNAAEQHWGHSSIPIIGPAIHGLFSAMSNMDSDSRNYNSLKSIMKTEIGNVTKNLSASQIDDLVEQTAPTKGDTAEIKAHKDKLFVDTIKRSVPTGKLEQFNKQLNLLNKP